MPSVPFQTSSRECAHDMTPRGILPNNRLPRVAAKDVSIGWFKFPVRIQNTFNSLHDRNRSLASIRLHFYEFSPGHSPVNVQNLSVVIIPHQSLEFFLSDPRQYGYQDGRTRHRLSQYA